MAGTVEAVAREIRSIRKGRGIAARDIDKRLGPYLRSLATAGHDRDPVAVRQALASQLATLASQLPIDLCTAIMASLGLSAETRHCVNFKDRVIWLSASLGYQYRTALRRIDAAERLLAEHISRELQRRKGRMATAPEGWYLAELRTLLRLDTHTPEAHEHRRIVATQDGLKEVMAWHDVPRTPDQDGTGATAEILYGGRLIRREQPSRSRIHFIVALPKPLRLGEVHEYGLLLRVPSGERLRPHYIFTPEYRCDTFLLRVRFDPDRRPTLIRRVEGETVRTFDDSFTRDQSLTLDSAGEVELRFDNPALYLGYGAQWWPSEM